MSTAQDGGVRSAFHELDLPNADELVVKSRLLHFVAGEVRGRGLTDEEIGDLLGIDHADVSALLGEKISCFPIDALMRLVGRLGFEVSIHIQGAGIEFDVPYERAA